MQAWDGFLSRANRRGLFTWNKYVKWCGVLAGVVIVAWVNLVFFRQARSSPNHSLSEAKWTYSSTSSLVWLPRLTKTKYSDKLRFVFFAGIEGTGHHALTNMWSNMPRDIVLSPGVNATQAFGSKQHDNGFRIVASKRLQCSLFSIHQTEQASLFNARGPHDQRTAIRTIVDEVNAFKKLSTKCPACERLVVLNTLFIGPTGMMSYPNFGTNGDSPKALKMPDLELLAYVMDNIAGADLRIVVLTRDPGLVLASDFARGFHKDPMWGVNGKNGVCYQDEDVCRMLQLRTLTHAQRMLSEQIRAIDQAFWACTNCCGGDHYQERALGMANHLHPAAATTASSPLVAALAEEMKSQYEHDNQRKAEVRQRVGSQEFYDAMNVTTFVLKTITDDITLHCPNCLHVC